MCSASQLHMDVEEEGGRSLRQGSGGEALSESAEKAGAALQRGRPVETFSPVFLSAGICTKFMEGGR